MPRTVIVDGCCSELVTATRGITAGSGFATEELCCLMLDVLDDIGLVAPTATVSLYVDDATVEAEGTRSEVHCILRAATKALADGVAAADLEVSVKKSVVLSSHPSVARRIACVRDRRGVRILRKVGRAKMLGCGTAGGRRRATHVQQHRLKATKDRLPRLRTLRRFGVPVARWQCTAGGPASQYGAETLGVADSVLHHQRVFAAAAISAPGAGKNTDAVLWLADAQGIAADPAFSAHELPAIALARALWDGWISAEEVIDGLQWALRRIFTHTSAAWGRVAGPFAAVLATLDRIGWTYDAAAVWFSDTGEDVDLERDSPKAVQLAVRSSVRRWRDRRLANSYPGLDPGHAGLVSYGVRTALRGPPKPDEPSSSSWTAGCRASLRSAVANGQWPQARLWQAGLVDHPRCLLCQAASGTLLHRRDCPELTIRCPPRDPPTDLLACWVMLSDAQRDLLVTRALLADLDLSAYPAAPEERFCWHVEPPDGLLCDDWTIYLDGSLRGGPSLLTGRAGWAFVAHNTDGKVMAAAYGVPPPWIKTIHGAEMWAFYAAVRTSLPGASFRSDRLSVVGTFKKGYRHATHPAVALARLWRLIFAACDDFDEPQHQVDLAWIPAHTAASDVGHLRLSNGEYLTAADRSGNDLADALAKQGAELHRLPEAVRQAYDRRSRLAQWAARDIAVRTYQANGGAGNRRDSAGLPLWRRRTGDPSPTHRRARATSSPCPPPPRESQPPDVSGPLTSADEEDLTAELPVPRPLRAATRRRALATARRTLVEAKHFQEVLDRRHASAAPSTSGEAAERMAALRERIRARQ